MEQKNIKPDNLNSSLVMKYDDEAMIGKYNSLSADNKSFLENVANEVNFPIENIADIILSADEGQRMQISALLGDLRMSTEVTSKKKAAKDLIAFLDNL